MSDVGGATGPAGRHTVLHIEDNEANRLLVERVFALQPNIELITATRGLTGLEMARDHQPAVVLLDMNLPDVNGDRVLKRLAKTHSLGASVVFLSAEASDRQIQTQLTAGAVAYSPNPSTSAGRKSRRRTHRRAHRRLNVPLAKRRSTWALADVAARRICRVGSGR